MSSAFNGTVHRSGNSLVLTIPKPVAEALGLVSGSKINAIIYKVATKTETEQ